MVSRGQDLIPEPRERRPQSLGEPWAPVSTCVVYDERPAARALLRRKFTAVPGVQEVILAASADELILPFAGAAGQVAVVGIQPAVPSGILAIRRVLAVRPGATVVAVGAREDATSAEGAIAVGARGFLSWDASPTAIRTLIHALTGKCSAELPASDHPCDAGECAVSVELDGLCREERKGMAPEPSSDVVVNGAVQERLGVSRLEIDVLRGILAGLTVADIGRELDLPDSTVKVGLRRLFVKLDVHEKALMSRSGLVARAYRSGLLARAGVIRCIRGSSLVPQ